MTLREKFYTYTDNEYSEKLTNAENCEKIADDFAIGFAEWIVSNCYCEDDQNWWLIVNEGDIKKSSKELLEIYKKEKGL
jgi:hypothetical protein